MDTKRRPAWTQTMDQTNMATGRRKPGHTGAPHYFLSARK